MEKIAVIGAGISGLSVARMLQDKADVVVFERATAPGGLVKCERIEGNLFHRVGGHVFNAKNKEVFNWFWSQFDQEKEFRKARRNARILMNGKLIGYPIENSLFEFDKETVAKVIKDLLEISKREKKNPFEYANFESFLKGTFGDTLYALYFQPYNHKIWNTDLSKVSLEWLEGKLPMPNIQDIILSNIVKETESEMVHASFYYPVEGGSQFIADRLAEGLQIRKQATVQAIQKEGGKLCINGEEVFDRIIYTGDIRQLRTIYQERVPELEAVESLKSNGTSNLFCHCDENDLSWLYIPEAFTKAHRIIYTGNFSASNNRGSTRKTCVVEFSGKCTLETMKEEIKKLPGNLEPIDSNYEPNSYVIQEKGTREMVQAVKQKLQSDHIYLLGRFAEWEYYNMDKAIEAAMDLVKTKF